MVRGVLQRSGINRQECLTALSRSEDRRQVWSGLGASSASPPIRSTRCQPSSALFTRPARIPSHPALHPSRAVRHEKRFIGFLIEHYAGNFPLLAPEQVRVLPSGDDGPLLEYARAIQAELRAHQVRAELDASNDHIKAKISSAEQMKVHTMLVIGNRDMEANAVSVRVHGKGNLGAKPRAEVVADLLQSIKERRL